MFVKKNLNQRFIFCVLYKNPTYSFNNLSIEIVIQMCYTITKEREVGSNEKLRHDFKAWG